MRLGVANTLGNRDSTTAKDERVLNGIVEGQGGRRREDKALVIKRPGMTSRYTLGTGQAGATTGQLLFAWQTPSAPGIAGTATLVGIRGDALTRPVT